MRYRCTVLALLLLLAAASSGCRLFFRLPEEITDPRIREVHRLGEIPEDEVWWQTRQRRLQEQDKLLFNFPLDQVWKQEFDTGRALAGTPVIDGRQIYITRASQGLIKLNEEDGIPVWAFALRSGEECGPPVEAEGFLVFATTAGRVIAVQPSVPCLAWETSIETERPGTPASGAGLVCYPTADGELLALSAADGSLAWRHSTGETLAAVPLLDETGGRVYCGSLEGTMFCIDAASGALQWRYASGAPIRATPQVSGKRICFGDDDGRFHCLSSEDGLPRWVRTSGASIRTQPAIFEKWVIFGSWDGFLYALDLKSGRTRWKTELPNRMELPPVCVDELVLVACLRSPELSAIRVEDGRPAGTFKLEHLDAWLTTAPAISDGNFLFAGTSRGKLLALAEIVEEEMSEEEASRARFEELLGNRGENPSPDGVEPGQ